MYTISAGRTVVKKIVANMVAAKTCPCLCVRMHTSVFVRQSVREHVHVCVCVCVRARARVHACT